MTKKNETELRTFRFDPATAVMDVLRLFRAANPHLDFDELYRMNEQTDPTDRRDSERRAQNMIRKLAEISPQLFWAAADMLLRSGSAAGPTAESLLHRSNLEQLGVAEEEHQGVVTDEQLDAHVHHPLIALTPEQGEALVSLKKSLTHQAELAERHGQNSAAFHQQIAALSAVMRGRDAG